MTGLGVLVRVALRRDRVLIPVCALGLAAFAVGSAKATVDLYPNADAARAGLGSVLTSPALVALYGPASANSLAGLSVLKTALMGAVFVGILAYGLVRRHTRVEEEAGRLELIQSGVVDRRSPLSAAIFVALIAVVLTSVVTAAGLATLGFDVRGSIAFGLAWCGVGIVMMAVTAVAAQLTSSARGASAWALGALGVAFLMRAIGDVSSSLDVLSWLSPVGWASKISAYDANRLWVFLLSLAFAVVLVVVAFMLLDRRDLGSGVLAARPGRARASIGLRSPQALVWRLDRPTAIGWTLVAVVLGLVVGGLVSSVQQMLQDPSIVDMLRKLGGGAGTLQELYVGTELRFVSVAFAACGVALALHLAAEERTGRTEIVLATAQSRGRWFGSHAAVALVVPSVLVLLMAAIIGGLGQHLASDAPSLRQCLVAGLVCLPAVWVVVAIGLALVGAGPQYAIGAWVVLAIAFVLGEFGSTLGLPNWLQDVSPFAHASVLPMGQPSWTPWVVLTVVAAVIIALGAAAHRTRDLRS